MRSPFSRSRRQSPDPAPLPDQPRASPFQRALRPAFWRQAYGEFVKRREKEKADLDVYRVLSENARAAVEYYVLILLSCLIATMGLIQNSVAVIIGAMIIAPLMTPILAFSLGVIWGDVRLMSNALFTLVKGVVCAVALSALISFAVPLSTFSAEVISRTKPSLFDILVALGSGALAAFGYANRKVINALTGIAIAVALMPPLCVVGIGLGKLDFTVVSGAALLFATNLVSISLAAAVVFWVMKIHPSSEDTTHVKRRALRQVLLSSLLLCLLAVPVGLSMASGYRLEAAETGARTAVARALPDVTILSEQTTREPTGMVLKLTVAAEQAPRADVMNALAAEIRGSGAVFTRADISYLPAVRFHSP